MRNHNNDTIKMMLEKYTSHFIWKGSKGLLKVLLCERWVGDWTELQHIDPHSYGHNSVSFPFSWAAQPGAWGSSLSGTCSSFQHLISNWLNFLCTELHNDLTSTLLPASFTISHSIQVISWYSSTGCTCYLTSVHFLFWQLGLVGGQYVTLNLLSCKLVGF